METAVYLSTTLITILWSVWTFSSWTTKVRLREDSLSRFWLVLAPSSYFLAAVAVGLNRTAIRFDLFALLFLDAVTVVSALFFLFLFQLGRTARKSRFKVILWIYNLLCFLGLVFVFVVRSSPVLIMRTANLLEQISTFRLFTFQWVALDPVSRNQDIPAIMNKLLIALFTYLPVSLLRFLYTNRKRVQLKRQLDNLVKRVDILERKVEKYVNSEKNDQE